MRRRSGGTSALSRFSGNYRRRMLGCAAVLVSASLLLACGSSSSGDDSNNSNEPTLAEVAADLPKSGTIYLEGDGSAANGSVSDSGNSSTTSQAQGGNASNNSSSAVSGVSFNMRRFLWKPDSERDGNLVVLVDPPGVRVEVFGSISETLTDFGPSNERGTTARGSFPGCRYGSGVEVRFYRGQQQLGFVNGTATVRIPDGCSRVEFNL